MNIDENYDAALFSLVTREAVSSMQRNSFDTPNVVGSPVPGMTVEKVGRTTGHTHGVIEARSIGTEAVEYTVVPYRYNSVMYFRALYAVRGTGQPFAECGDSGSLVVTRTNQSSLIAVGLVPSQM